ncbi:MAG: tyrosine-type recombinase/integrase [Pannonibacter sp.]
MPNLTKRIVDAAKPQEKLSFLWDDALKGFGLQITPAGVKSYVLAYRTEEGRTRRMVIGRHGELAPEQARKLAAARLGQVRTGKDPAAERRALRTGDTVADLLQRFLTAHVDVQNAESTRKEVRRLVAKVIIPRIGKAKVTGIKRQDIAKFHSGLAETPRQANVALSVLSKAFNLAEIWGLRPELSNPTRLVKRFPEVHRERFLNMEELARLGAVLDEAEERGLPWKIKAEGDALKRLTKDPDAQRAAVSAPAIAAIRLLLLTGARLSEVLELKWVHVDAEAGTVAFPARKGGGRRAHPVGAGALAVLAGLPRRGPWVLPRDADPKRHVSKEVVENAWQRIRAHAGLEDVRLHDLRHTVGTFAGQAGSNAFLISHLLRHSNLTMTNRYVSPDADPIRVLSDAVGARIEAGLKGEKVPADVIDLAAAKRNRPPKREPEQG